MLHLYIYTRGVVYIYHINSAHRAILFQKSVLSLQIRALAFFYAQVAGSFYILLHSELVHEQRVIAVAYQ